MAEEKDLREEIDALVRPLFRPGSMVQTAEVRGGLVISAGWRLGSHRMDNWSREIQVLIPPQIAERLSKLNERGRKKADANIVSFIRRKLADFRPEHDRPRFLLPPVEPWELSYDEVFPKAK